MTKWDTLQYILPDTAPYLLLNVYSCEQRNRLIEDRVNQPIGCAKRDQKLLGGTVSSHHSCIKHIGKGEMTLDFLFTP